MLDKTLLDSSLTAPLIELVNHLEVKNIDDSSSEKLIETSSKEQGESGEVLLPEISSLDKLK